MAELTDEHKTEIMLLFARFRSPAEVTAEMNEKFGLEMVIQQTVKYDPERPSFEAGDKWRTLHDLARKQFIENISAIPVANQGYRLELLQRGIQDAISKGKWAAAAALAEQAARETGGLLTNQRNVSIDNRGRARDMSAEERREMLMGMIDERLGRLTDEGSATVQ